MSSARLQNTRSTYKHQLYFYTPTINIQKKAITFIIESKEYKLRYKLNKRSERLVYQELQNITEKNKKDLNKRKDYPCS